MCRNLPPNHNTIYTISGPITGMSLVTFTTTSKYPIVFALTTTSEDNYDMLITASCDNVDGNNIKYNSTVLSSYFQQQASGLVGLRDETTNTAIFAFARNYEVYLVNCQDQNCDKPTVNTIEVKSTLDSNLFSLQLQIDPITKNPSIGFQGNTLLLVNCSDSHCLNYTIVNLYDDYIYYFGMAYGPDNFLYYIVHNVTHYLFIHCLDQACVNTSIDNKQFNVDSSGNLDRIQMISNEILMTFIAYYSAFVYIPVCGPFVTTFTPHTAAYAFDNSITVNGQGLCGETYCKIYNNQTSIIIDAESSNNPTSRTCKIKADTLQEGNYSILFGSKTKQSFALYSQQIDFYSVIFCPNNCSKHGECDYMTGKCTCKTGYYKSDCSVNYETLGIAVITTILSATVLVIVVQGILFFKHIKPQRFDTPTKINRNFSNLVTIIATPIEFVQLVVFGLNIKSEWTGKLYQGVSFTLFNFPYFDVFILFWVVFVLTALWCIYMFPLLVRRKGKLLIESMLEIGMFKSLYSWTFIILVPFCTFLQMPIIGTFLRMVSCHYWKMDLSNGPLLNGTDVVCWEGTTTIISVAALIMFFCFFPLVIYALPTLQNLDADTDVLYYNRFIFVQQSMYVLLTVANKLFIDFEIFRMIFAIIVAMVLLWANVEMKPCNVENLNIIKSSSYLFVIFSGAMSLWAFFEPPTYRVPLIVLCLGFVVVIIGMIVLLTGCIQRKRDRTQETLVKAFKDASYQPLLNKD